LISEKLYFSNNEVRVLILVDENMILIKNHGKPHIQKNSSFSFLSESAEYIHTTDYGKPLND